jgi:hypothetical protein
MVSFECSHDGLLGQFRKDWNTVGFNNNAQTRPPKKCLITLFKKLFSGTQNMTIETEARLLSSARIP